MKAEAAPTVDREQSMRARLQAAFAPLELRIVDDSQRHAGHAGAAGGLGHYGITIVAAAFEGLPAVARHRRIYTALGDLMKTDIHALAICAQTPAEAGGPARSGPAG